MRSGVLMPPCLINNRSLLTFPWHHHENRQHASSRSHGVARGKNIVALSSSSDPGPPSSPEGRSSVAHAVLPVESYDPFPSTVAPARRVDVMLPPSYTTSSAATRHYPVLYVHDGQNCIDPATSFLGTDWGLDEAQQQLVKAGLLQEFIAVLVWNTPQRLQEYMPAGAVRWLMSQQQCWYESLEECYYNPTSDAYLDMLVHEIKPFVDAKYRTLCGKQHTAVMGSSMGGLVSLYALQQHPQVFGAAACLSTHWVPGNGLPAAWLEAGNIPDPATHRMYFDHGSLGLDAEYGPYQQRVNKLCLESGYQQGVNFDSRVFPGADHNEMAWRQRLHVPLQFLFAAKPEAPTP